MSSREGLDYHHRQTNALSTINYLLKRSKISPSTGMIVTNHPQLGGGIVFSLGHISNPNTCLLIDRKNKSYLWLKNNWKEVKKREAVNWLKKQSTLIKSSLVELTAVELRNSLNTLS